jgi:DNA-binding SARP family transcriptional activator/tetratricopeptide (TPR) repeat protein
MLRLHVFGGLRLDVAGDAMPAPAARRRTLALLALVATAGPRGITRERLLGILWPDRPEEQGRHALAQALYALRKELGTSEPFEPAGAAFRLNRAVLTSDVGEFLEALERGDRTSALAVYAGPFLQGFYLPQADEFERWAEDERARFGGLFREALEAEASALEVRNDLSGAARRWREVIAIEPLLAAPRLRLMRCLAAAGESQAAIEEARQHRETLARELGVGPDTAVAQLEEALRHTTATDRHPERPLASTPVPDGIRPRRSRHWIVAAVLGIVIVGFVAALLSRGRSAESPIVAVGVVESHLASDSAGLARSLGDLLATHLVQVPELRVVARARLLEVLGQDAQRPGAAVLARAARLAGADELVEGVLYDDPAGYRLDLRRTGLGDGEVHQAVSVTARDPVSLVETAVAELARTWGFDAPTLPLRSVTSVSLAARRYYEEGLRAYFAGEQRTAAGLFRLALSEDTTFAMAAFYLARSDGEADAEVNWPAAIRLAAHANDRERLLILAMGALEMNDARGLAYAETLAVRYPEDLDGIRILGELRMALGDFAAAAAAFDRVIALDSAGRAGRTARCHACEAAFRGVSVSLIADSLARAERIARAMSEWPGGRISSPALLAAIHLRQGRTEEAVAAAREAARLEPSISAEAAELDGLHRAGHVPRLDSITSLRLISAQLPESRTPVLERLSRIRREGGRPRSALAVATERLGLETPAVRATAAFAHLERALAFLELGRHDPRSARAAAALFDSMAAMPSYTEVRMARHRAWMWTHVATALARAGDTAALPELQERIERMAARSSYGRDRRLGYYVRGLLEEARGNREEARLAYTAALWSPTENMVAPALARMALATNRASDAVRVLEAYLRGPLDAANQYVPRWEVHRLLGDAYLTIGMLDRSRSHYDWVRRALREAEPEYRAMVDSLP